MRRLLLLAPLLLGLVGCTPTAGPSPQTSTTSLPPELPAVLAMPADAFSYGFLVRTYTDATLKGQVARDVKQRISGGAAYIDEHGVPIPGPRINTVRTPWIHHAAPGPGVIRITASYELNSKVGEAITCQIVGAGDVPVPGTLGVAVVTGHPGVNMGLAEVLCGSIEF